MKKKEISAEDALLRAASLCAASEQCEKEILTKLNRWGVAPADISAILRRLKDGGYVDNARYARAFVHDKVNYAHWGRYKVQMALRQRGIAREDIEVAFENVDYRQYAKIALMVMRNKLRQLPDDLPKPQKRDKLIRFGATRGFEMSLLIKIVESDRLWQ